MTAKTKVIVTRAKMATQPVRYKGASCDGKSWLPIIPEVLADMMNTAIVMARSPAEPALRAIQEPFKGST